MVGRKFEHCICNIVFFATIILVFSPIYKLFSINISDEILQTRVNIMTQCCHTRKFLKITDCLYHYIVP